MKRLIPTLSFKGQFDEILDYNSNSVTYHSIMWE